MNALIGRMPSWYATAAALLGYGLFALWRLGGVAIVVDARPLMNWLVTP